jgi:hypothetical protein
VRAAVLSLLLGLAACGGKVAVDLALVGSGGGGGGGGGADCGVNGMPVPPAFKACTALDQCAIAFVTLDCCGAQAAVGVATGMFKSFSAYELACNPLVPSCACDPGPAHTDDGQTTSKANAIFVSCDDGQCLTHVQ